MNIGNMTVLEKHSISNGIPSSTSVPVTASSRGAALNPEASVFCLPNRELRTSSSASSRQTENVHLFMNGDVGKRSCGDASPTSELVSQEVLQDVSDSKKHGSESHPSKMTDTMAESSDEMLQDSSEAVFSAPATEEEVAETQTETPNGESPEEKTKETQGSSSLAQKGGNDDTGQGLEEQPKTPQVVSEGSSQASKEPLTRDQIKDLVSQNVEYFFSRENWSSDAYLLSQMDSDQYVPVYILANCSQFKSITKDHSIILDALKESDFVQLDEENNRVRPNYKRCIVILREIPELTPVKEIEAMFEGEGCPKSISCEFVHNGFWYVTFESDSDAQKAYRYLRETVKTFKDKPILARIKTKPMSRIGCLSVLPSYGGKSVGGEAGERPPPNLGPGGNSNCLPQGGPPGNPGLQGVPNPPPPPPPNAYPPNNPQRMFYPSQNNMNASYPNYNFAASIQIPAAAYFYPNPMMQWPTPNFYDINSFIQYNGLSPRATYKPPANTRFSTASNNTNNMNRRNKNRDPKNNDSRHASGSGFNSGSQIRPNHPQGSSSRPHSSHSPHPYNSNHQSAHPNLGSGGGIHSMGGLSSIGNPPANQHGVDGSVSGSSTPKSIPPSSSNGINNNSNNSNKSTTIPTSANGFAQNDLSLASQSNLYTSFSGASQKSLVVPEKPETGDANGSKPPSSASQASSPEDEESISRVSNGVAPAAESASGAASTSVTSSSSTTDASSPSFSQSTARSESNLTSGSQAPSSSSQTNSSSGAPAHPPHPSFHHHHPAPPLPHPHPHHQGGLPVSHRSSFNGSENPHIRDAQPQRQMSRGGRRRVTRREDEMNGHSAPSGGGGRGSQRTPGGGGADASSHKNAPNSEMKKPSFELQATSFPPLPSSEELAAAVPEEKTTPDAPQQTPWAGETHKFSDVMKGTAKPKSTPASAGGGADAESASDALAAPQATNSAEHPPPPPPPGPSAKRGGDRVPNPSSSTTSQSGTVPEPPSPSPSSRGSSGVAGAAKPSEPPPPAGGGTSSGSASSFSRVERGIGGMRGGGLREVERRSVGPVGARRERDFVPGVGRGGVRRADREGGGGFRFSGNKENRPAPNRSWREDRPDPDGWITKGPRDPRNHRGGEQRYQHQNSSHQHKYYESRNSNSTDLVPNINGSEDKSSSSRLNSISNHETVEAMESSAVTSSSSVEYDQNLKEDPPRNDPVGNDEGDHKTSWAKMALASKDQMERLSAELKEKEEQEKLKKNRATKPLLKIPERVNVGREREGSKPFRRENNFFLREREKEREFKERGRGDFVRGADKASTAPASSSSSSSYSTSLGFKSLRETLVPKSPK